MLFFLYTRRFCSLFSFYRSINSIFASCGFLADLSSVHATKEIVTIVTRYSVAAASPIDADMVFVFVS